jgi:hypothetical protein
MKRYSE